jgi:hypothetical protein
VDDPLEMDWSTFVAKVRADQHHSAEQRVEVLATTRVLFESQLHFSDLQPVERKAIAGTLGKNERARDFGFYEWGWFGTTGAFGVFKNRINENVPEISAALDWIPLNGPVSDVNYQRFIQTFLEAFEGSPRQPGIAHASRLLAMKRPDYFVSFNKPNSRGLSAHFGVRASSVNLSTYWNDIIEPITYSKWWRSPRPRGADGRIWDGRAAFLDALYYQPD